MWQVQASRDVRLLCDGTELWENRLFPFNLLVPVPVVDRWVMLPLDTNNSKRPSIYPFSIPAYPVQGHMGIGHILACIYLEAWFILNRLPVYLSARNIYMYDLNNGKYDNILRGTVLELGVKRGSHVTLLFTFVKSVSVSLVFPLFTTNKYI